MKKFLSLVLCVLLFASITLTTSAETTAGNENKHFIAGGYICEINKNNEILINYYIGTSSAVTVPGSINGLTVKSIGKWAFFGSNVKEVIISEGITSIEKEAFYNCQSLETVVLPSTMERTGEAVFRFCQNLKNVTFSGTEPTSQKDSGLLGKYLFYACNSLEDVNIPNNQTSIPRGMFAYCQNLDTVDLPTETEQINNNAFYGSGLTSITLPERLISIYTTEVVNGNMLIKHVDRVFESNSKLTAINVDPANVKFASVDGVLYEKDSDGNIVTLVFCPRAKTGTVTVLTIFLSCIL